MMSAISMALSEIERRLPPLLPLPQLDGLTPTAQQWPPIINTVANSFAGHAGESWVQALETIGVNVVGIAEDSVQLAQIGRVIVSHMMGLYRQLVSIGARTVAQAAPVLASALVNPAALPQLAAIASQALAQAHAAIIRTALALQPQQRQLEILLTPRFPTLPTLNPHHLQAQLQATDAAVIPHPALAASTTDVNLPTQLGHPTHAGEVAVDTGIATEPSTVGVMSPTAPAPSEVPLGGDAGSQAARAALSAVGTPYVWGGNTPGVGLDCSGLTHWAYQQAGIEIPRTADAQALGPQIPPSELQPGDLAVWSGHVAMYVGDGQIVEAGDPVSVSALRTTNMGMPFYGFYRPAAQS